MVWRSSRTLFLHPIEFSSRICWTDDGLSPNLGMASDSGNSNSYGSLSPGLGDYNARCSASVHGPRTAARPANTDTGSPSWWPGQLGAGQVVASALEIGRASVAEFLRREFRQRRPDAWETPDGIGPQAAVQRDLLAGHAPERRTRPPIRTPPGRAPRRSLRPGSFPSARTAAQTGSPTPRRLAAVWGNFIFRRRHTTGVRCTASMLTLPKTCWGQYTVAGHTGMDSRLYQRSADAL